MNSGFIIYSINIEIISIELTTEIDRSKTKKRFNEGLYILQHTRSPIKNEDINDSRNI